MLILFSPRFCRELKKLAKRTPDLPVEILRTLAAGKAGSLPGEITMALSKSRDSLLAKCRLGSKQRGTGKRGGFRAYFARSGEHLLMLEIISKAEISGLPASRLQELARRCVEESFEALEEHWLTLEDFRSEFGV